jgi:GAF domain-containing protein
MSRDPRAAAMTALSRFLVADLSLGETLHRVATITMEALPAATVAGISMLGTDGMPTTGVYTDETSPEIDAAQYSTGNGPCLDAWRTKQVVRIDDMETDGKRYPEFAAAARRHGIASTLSLPLISGESGVGALNLYATWNDAFTAEDAELGMDVAAAAAVVIANAGAYWDAFELSEDLSVALRSRAVIEQAKGMLMARSELLSADDAFDILRKASQRENVKLRGVAQRIVDRKPLLSEPDPGAEQR